MKKTRRPVVPMPTPPPEPRQQLRDFKSFVEAHDPVLLARLATDIPGTLAAVAYGAEVRRRRVQ